MINFIPKSVILILGLLYCFTPIFSQDINLVYPKNNMVFEDSSIQFIWDANTIYSYYNIQISTDSSFSLIILDSTNITSNSIILNTLTNKQQYWKVIAKKITGGFDTSAIHSYKTINFSQLTNLYFRFIAESGITESGGKVTQWDDKGPNSLSITQSNPDAQPLLISNDQLLNNKSYVSFDGADDYLKTTLFDLPQPLNYFILVKIRETDGDLMDGGDINKHLLRINSSSINFYSGVNYVSSLTPPDTNKFLILNFELDVGITKFYINNSLIATNFTGNNSSGGLHLGAMTYGGNPIKCFIPEMIAFNNVISDSLRETIFKYFIDKYTPPVNLGANIYAPNFCDTVLYAGKRFTNYQWQDSSNSDSLIVTETGWYSCTATDIFGFQSTDSVYVQFPTINQLTNNTICQGNPLLWNTNLSPSTYNFEWNDSSTDSSLTISQPGDYWVKVTDSLGCFKYSDTITIAIDSFPTQTTLGIDKTVCQGATIGLEIGNNVVSYLWSTNDTTAQITIDTAGTYWVQAQNNNGCIASDTIQITVNGIAPTVLFNAMNACNNSPTLFNNTSFTTDGSNIISSFWTFGTGDTSNLQNPSYYYLATGNYTVTLQIITDSGCTNTLTQQIQVYKKPTAGFFPTNSLMCSSQNSFFTENSFSTDGIINNWLWDFGTTSIFDTSSFQNGNYAYVLAGNYSVQLIVTTEFGCRDTTLNLINIKPSPTANFIIQDSCLTNQTKFTNLSTGTISTTNWDFGDANSSSLLNPSHVYANAGSYDVKLAIKATNGCWDTLIKPFTIYDNPVADFITDDYCVLSNYQLIDNSTTNVGNLTSWQWDISSLSFQSNNQNPTINFNYGDSGIYQLKLKVINNFGCNDSVTKTIGVYPLPVPNFNFSPEIGLPPLVVDFTNLSYGGSLSYWVFGDGNSSTNISPTYTYQDSGIFMVTLYSTSLYGCVDSISKTIQITEPIIDLAVKTIFYEFVPNTNFMKISVQLANEGSVTIQNMDLILQNSSTGTILETWNGNLAPNLQNIYRFSSLIEMPNGEIPSLICVTATNINRGVDANLSNNEFCKALNKFELINIYPNPTSKDLFLEFISPSETSLEINLFDNTGKIISNLFTGKSIKGINRKSFVMSIYSQGLYIIEIKNQEEIIRKKFMIE